MHVSSLTRNKSNDPTLRFGGNDSRGYAAGKGGVTTASRGANQPAGGISGADQQHLAVKWFSQM